MRKKISGILLLVAVIVSPAMGEVTVPSAELMVLGGEAEICHDPAISAAGNQVAVSWTGLVDGRTRILTATRPTDGDWRPSTPIDESAEGDCTDSAVKISPLGNAGYTWIHKTGDEYAIFFRSAGTPQERVAASPLRMETPSLSYDQNGHPIIAWSEGGGGKFAVIVARRGENTEWTRTVLSSGLDAYDILPTTFGGAAPRVYWYRLDGRQFQLSAVEWNDQDWGGIPSDFLGSLPANRLPYLYDTQSSLGPGAVWIEPMPGGELVMTADPRWKQGDLVRPLPGHEQARQLEPDASSDAHRPSFAWREETTKGSDVMVLTEDDIYRVTGLAHMTQPRIADGGDSGLHLIVVSDQIEGGTGRVYYKLLAASD